MKVDAYDSDGEDNGRSAGKEKENEADELMSDDEKEVDRSRLEGGSANSSATKRKEADDTLSGEVSGI
jgi:hypothetical protein